MDSSILPYKLNQSIYHVRGCLVHFMPNFRNRGSYMSAHVLLNLSNEFGGKDKMRDFAYRFSPASLINSIIQEHECKILFIIGHLNSILLASFALKRSDFAIRKREVYMDVNVKRYDVICIFNPLVDYRFNTWLYYTLRGDVIWYKLCSPWSEAVAVAVSGLGMHYLPRSHLPLGLPL